MVTGGIDTITDNGYQEWSQRQWLTATASVLAILVLSIISIALIMQAMRLDAEGASLPPRLQADFAATSRSSWIGGIAALVGMVMNVVTCGLFARINSWFHWPCCWLL